jgi:hypothetical protein
MNLNADLVARAVLRLLVEREALEIQRDALAEENDKLRNQTAQVQQVGPRAVPDPGDQPA